MHKVVPDEPGLRSFENKEQETRALGFDPDALIGDTYNLVLALDYACFPLYFLVHA